MKNQIEKVCNCWQRVMDGFDKSRIVISICEYWEKLMDKVDRIIK